MQIKKFILILVKDGYNKVIMDKEYKDKLVQIKLRKDSLIIITIGGAGLYMMIVLITLVGVFMINHMALVNKQINMVMS